MRSSKRLTTLYDFPRTGVPFRRGSRYFFTHNSGLRISRSCTCRTGRDGERRVLIDPNTMSADGPVALTAIEVERRRHAGRVRALGERQRSAGHLRSGSGRPASIGRIVCGGSSSPASPGCTTAAASSTRGFRSPAPSPPGTSTTSIRSVTTASVTPRTPTAWCSKSRTSARRCSASRSATTTAGW